MRRKKSWGGKDTKKRKVYGKIKWKGLWRLTERQKVSSDRFLVFVRARVSWGNLQVQCMCAKVKWMLKWDEWVIRAVFISKRKSRAGKFPPPPAPREVPAKSSTVGSASYHRMWGTWSCKNLMRVSLKCRSIRSRPRAVKKGICIVKGDVKWAQRNYHYI